jgi:DNA-binding transcriptional ArsR family regulator
MRPASDQSPFHAIADPTRRRLLTMLRSGACSASELAEPFSQSRSAVSQHLAVLRRAGLVERDRQGRHQVYRLNPGPLREVADWTAAFDAFWDDKLGALGRYLEEHGK